MTETLIEGIFASVADALGPAGTAFAITTVVLGYFYRRDMKRQNGQSKDAHERLLKAYENNAVSAEKLAVTVMNFQSMLERQEGHRSNSADAMVEKVQHSINAGFAHIILELKNQGRVKER